MDYKGHNVIFKFDTPDHPEHYIACIDGKRSALTRHRKIERTQTIAERLIDRRRQHGN